mmetsp:Transcript_37010/g.116296  ORF Transcript_37010/g.116296 Transcript_37010/m.116296 type:complete len:223 (+) Transcript_37010:695-1363(+)
MVSSTSSCSLKRPSSTNRRRWRQQPDGSPPPPLLLPLTWYRRAACTLTPESIAVSVDSIHYYFKNLRASMRVEGKRREWEGADDFRPRLSVSKLAHQRPPGGRGAASCLAPAPCRANQVAPLHGDVPAGQLEVLHSLRRLLHSSCELKLRMILLLLPQDSHSDLPALLVQSLSLLHRRMLPAHLRCRGEANTLVELLQIAGCSSGSNLRDVILFNLFVLSPM